MSVFVVSGKRLAAYHNDDVVDSHVAEAVDIISQVVGDPWRICVYSIELVPRRPTSV